MPFYIDYISLFIKNQWLQLSEDYIRIILSANSTSQRFELYEKLEGEDKQALHELLKTQKDKLQNSSDDWQSMNLSHSRALKLLQVWEIKE